MNSETHNGTVGLHRLEYYRLKHTQIYSEVSTALPKLKRFSRDSSFGPSFTLRKSQDPKATPPIFCSVSICLEKSLFQPQNMLRICLHIEKGPLTT